VFATQSNKHSLDVDSNPSKCVGPRGFETFHNQVYYPVRALVTGINPYSKDYLEYHPQSELGKQIAMDPVPPSTLLILSPLAFLQRHAAEIAYMVICILLTLFCASFLLRVAKDGRPGVGGTLILSALMMLCLPGLESFTSYPTIMLTLTGVLLALEFSGKSDFISGVGVVLSFCQPLIGAAILVFLLFRRNFSAFAFGILLLIVANVLTLGWITKHTGSVSQTFEDARGVYTHLYTPVVPEHVATSTDRVDAWSAVARIFVDQPETLEFPNLKLLITGGIVLLALFALVAERDHQQRQGLVSRSGMLIALVTILYFYQSTTSLHLLWIPVVGLLIDSERAERAFSLPLRFILGLLVVLPLFNYFVTPYAMAWLKISPTAVITDEPAPFSLRTLLEAWEFASPDLAQWQTVVTANTVLIALAALIIALRMIFSTWADGEIIEEQRHSAPYV